MSRNARPKMKDGRRKDLIQKFTKLHKEAMCKDIELENIRAIFLHKDIYDKSCKATNDTRNYVNKVCSGKGVLKTLSSAVVLIGVLYAVVANNIFQIQTIDTFKSTVLSKQHCVLKNYHYARETFRPLVNCSMCSSITEVPIERNISIEEFRTKYLYTLVPVVIKEATLDWTALTTYSFNYFKDLYQKTEGAFMYREGGCLSFMPYATEFNSLDEVFKMEDDRAKCKEGYTPWYVGWMNCKKGIQNELRKHYKRPYFLPNDTESSVINWVFMGGPGPGVPIHIDVLVRPSWQAQISGTKTWTFVPVPECESQCSTMNATLQKGDIVVMNVNHWYHTTYVHPGEISIAIGSEYD